MYTSINNNVYIKNYKAINSIHLKEDEVQMWSLFVWELLILFKPLVAIRIVQDNDVPIKRVDQNVI